jgi:hypothetical protein
MGTYTEDQQGMLDVANRLSQIPNGQGGKHLEKVLQCQVGGGSGSSSSGSSSSSSSSSSKSKKRRLAPQTFAFADNILRDTLEHMLFAPDSMHTYSTRERLYKTNIEAQQESLEDEFDGNRRTSGAAALRFTQLASDGQARQEMFYSAHCMPLSAHIGRLKEVVSEKYNVRLSASCPGETRHWLKRVHRLFRLSSEMGTTTLTEVIHLTVAAADTVEDDDTMDTGEHNNQWPWIGLYVM